MKELVFLSRMARRYDLQAEFINEDQLKISSKKYDFDAWIIEVVEDELHLWHKTKRNFENKCRYHLHKVVKKRNKRDLLIEIAKHNRYVAFYKHRNKVNMVDRVLSNPKTFTIN